MTMEDTARRKLAVLEALKTLGAAVQGFIEKHRKNVRTVRGQESSK